MRHSWHVCLALGLWLGLSTSVQAQGKEYKQAPKISPNDTSTINKYRQGVEEPKKDDALFNKLAQSFVYRLDDPEVIREQKAGGVSGKGHSAIIDKAIADSLLFMPPYLPQPKSYNAFQRAYIQYYGKALLAAACDKIQARTNSLEDLMVSIAAVRIISELAKTGYEPTGDVCAAIISGQDAVKALEGKAEPFAYPDALKGYALQGLHHLLAVRDPTLRLRSITDIDREARVLRALTTYIETPPTGGSKGIPPDELAAFQYLRRNAVRALGSYPFASFKDRQGKVVRPAFTMLCVATNDNMDPPTTPSEQFEAIIGYCNMRPDKSLRTDVGAYWVGKTLVSLAEVRARDQRDKAPPVLKWKESAVRMIEAVKLLADNAEPKYRPMASEFATQTTQNILSPFEKGATPDLNSYNKYLGSPTFSKIAQPPTLFEGVAETLLPRTKGKVEVELKGDPMQKDAEKKDEPGAAIEVHRQSRDLRRAS